MNTLMVSNTRELNDLHQQIKGKLRSTVQDAIRAGEILTKVKDDLPHGEIGKWIKTNCIFSHQTAYNYMSLFQYKGKIKTVLNLPEAYKQVKQLESAKKQTENQKAFKRVQEFKQTGSKPEGWRKNTDDKIYQEEIDRDERIKRFKEKVATDKQAKESREKDYKQGSERFNEAFARLTSKADEREVFKENIRISFEGKESSFVDALIDYLQGLDDDSRRLEACNNIIKVAKNIARELQRKAYTEA